ncbi:MAG: hypothetical protein RLZZ621_244, partial [Gemmatimonadota bacterium]
IFAVSAGVVVVDLVIIPRHEPGAARVGRLQQRVALVLGVATAIVIERPDLEAVVLAECGRWTRAFVDVIAEVDGEVEAFFLREMIVRGEEPLIPPLAGHEREMQCVEAAVRWRGAETANRARGPSTHEAIEIPPIRLESGDIDVDAEGELGGSEGASLLHDLREPLIVRHFPVHRRAEPFHAAVGLERAWAEPGPEHATRRRRVPGGHAELKRVVGEVWAGGDAPQIRDGGAQRRIAREVGKKEATVHA